jgi:hypothetical protein
VNQIGARITAHTGRPQERALALSEMEREELGRLSRSQSAPHGLVRRFDLASRRVSP